MPTGSTEKPQHRKGTNGSRKEGKAGEKEARMEQWGWGTTFSLKRTLIALVDPYLNLLLPGDGPSCVPFLLAEKNKTR